MRYLGNKESITSTIKEKILQKVEIKENTVLFDAFCGMGSVANAFKNVCNIILNDNLNCAATFAYGRMVASSCGFKALGFDPFAYLNTSEESLHGYFYTNYSPGGSDRMYFSAENAARIDFFRESIERWFIHQDITWSEYQYLLACLMESVSFVSNTAGVYGAFLKKWDERALKPIIFMDVADGAFCTKDIRVHTDKIEDIIQKIDCDILYLDPPYTQNQYGTQYHLLETLVLNDKPEKISPITGSRSTAEMRSDWSKIYKAHILLDKILAETLAEHIFLSYNNAGDMSKEFIESLMKRYAYENSYECIKIPYKKYENWKSKNREEHFEYLFYIRKKPPCQVVYESPLNYIGSKAKIVPYILKYKRETNCFFDVFGGGLNVGINVSADLIYYNDINFIVKDLMQSFRDFDTYEYILFLKKFIETHRLEKGNKENYLAARDYYNKLADNKKDVRMLFALILYSYQQQIRFNGHYEFNNPAGVRWFNDCILAKFISFSREVKKKNICFLSKDYIDIETEIPLSENTYMYFDPPYKLTTGSYNDGKRGFKGWNDKLEQELFHYIDSLSDRNIPCMLSYVLEHKGERNHALERWIKRRGYTCIELGDVIGISGKPRKEVLIINHGV